MTRSSGVPRTFCGMIRVPLRSPARGPCAAGTVSKRGESGGPSPVLEPSAILGGSIPPAVLFRNATPSVFHGDAV